MCMKRLLPALLLLTLAVPAWGQDYGKGLDAALRVCTVELEQVFGKDGSVERD